ncbi:outer membrane protein assembly factor BamC [uncultured Ramlibacter sp.]|uniref:outer membrane protein assembly factor BamC n=1 Tax=uncultured Ramlibacter sp. TaxID=260755 RepID=UPI00260F5BA5|nr:outer membrane protein assembly factor BamC [uncultured Ramlibacter sp.]
MKQSAKLSLLALCAALASCSVLDGDKIDYKSASKGVSLEVPPDLTQLSRDTRYTIPGGAVTASSFQVGQAAPTMPTAATTLGDVRIERAGTQRWLVINRPADQLWNPIRDFWQENGFLLTLDQSNLGIMETDWAENRAKIPQDFIRQSLGKLLDSFYSTAERDRFRTRLERTATGGTEIYVSHRGMIEVYANREKDQTVWQPRPTDPELEAEFLRRLMIKLGAPQEQAKALVASGAVKPVARVASVNNTPVVQIDEGFDRAWRRVGLSLDRTGFTVEDRDRAQGTYFVRYVEPNADKQDKGFLGKLFSSEKTVTPLKYRITLKSQGDATTVSVLNAAGAPEASANAQRIVQVIADDLK